MAIMARFFATLAVVVAMASSITTEAAVRIERITTSGGIEAWFVRDRTVPIISVSFSFEGGATLDPGGKEGLADMVSGLLDEGAGKLESQAFQRALEDISASLSFHAGRDRFGGSLRTLSAHRGEAFRLLGLAVTGPRFDADPVERIRSHLIASLMAQQENPRRIAGRTWYRTVFPSDPYGRPVAGTPETVKAIGRDDLWRFMRQRLTREGLKIGVVGDIDPGELARRLDQAFGALPARGGGGAVPDAAPAGAGKLVVVRKPIPQSVVVFGQPGVKRDHPDYYALYVLNHVVGGGGFSSRLTKEIREKRGLAYAVYSYLNPLDRAGLIMGGLATQNARVSGSLELLRAEWRRAARDGITTSELAEAKTYINGSFPLRLDSGRRIAGMLVAIQVSKLGIDYIERRSALIDAVAIDDIRRVAGGLLDADKLTVVVVGDPKGVVATP